MKKNLISRISLVLLIEFVVSCTNLCFPQEPGEAEIKKRVQEYENAYNRGDAKAVADIYAVNGSHTYANGIIHRSRAEIEKGLVESLSGPMKGTMIKITPEVIRFPANNVAVEEASFILTGLKMQDGVEMPAVKGFCLGVYQKQENEWFALAIQCMVPLSPPPQK
jgi:uncharacterized protein (TIGR02246 family)